MVTKSDAEKIKEAVSGEEEKKELKYVFVTNEEKNSQVLIFRTLLLTNLILGCTEILCM